MLSVFCSVIQARADSRQKAIGEPSVGSRGRGSEAVRARPLHEPSGGPRSPPRVADREAAGSAARHRRGAHRRNRTLGLAEHTAHQHGEER